jgi:hypothetical protein
LANIKEASGDVAGACETMRGVAVRCALLWQRSTTTTTTLV